MSKVRMTFLPLTTQLSREHGFGLFLLLHGLHWYKVVSFLFICILQHAYFSGGNWFLNRIEEVQRDEQFPPSNFPKLIQEFN
jgi:hypothetical protein